MYSSIWLVILFGAILFTRIVHYALISPLRHVPGPLYTLWTHLPLKLNILAGRRMNFVHDLHQKYGPIVRLSPNEVSLNDLESHQQIYKVGSGFNKSRWYLDFINSPRPGIFALTDPKKHAVRRKLFSRPFSVTSLRTLWEPVILQKSQLAVVNMLKEIEKLGEADMFKWWTFFSTDIAGHLMFGESFRMLESGKKNEYIRALELFVVGNGIAATFHSARLLGYLPIPIFQHMFKQDKYLYNYAEKAVKNGRGSRTNGNIFSPLFAEVEKADGVIDEQDIRMEAGTLIIGGSDTTAVTLTYMIWCIIQDPDLRRKLELEAKSLPHEFSDADLQNLPLLNATIEESLRLFTAAPESLQREVPEGGASFHGHFIPAGITASTQAWSLNRIPELWDEPERFNPYRFMVDDAEYSANSTKTAPRSAIAPFGSGSRICLGIHLAYMEMRYAVVYFLRECMSVRLSPSTTLESMEPEVYFLIKPKSHKCMVKLG